jgi:hypothetical protein
MIQLFLNQNELSQGVFLRVRKSVVEIYSLSLHIGLWNLIFLGSYLSLFVAIPFAYFFIESEGFAGSKKVTSFTTVYVMYT